MKITEIKQLNKKLFPENKKFCSSCDSIKLRNEFTVNSLKWDGLASKCKKCRSVKRHNNRAEDNTNFLAYEHRPYVIRNNKNSSYKRQYGITIDQYEQMLIEQNNVCKICQKPEKSKTKKNLTVDHSHITGKVRGLLCHSCNVSIGLLKEDLNIIENLLIYLKEKK